MGKLKGADDFRKEIYQGMTQIGYQQPFEVFAERNSNPEEAGRLHGLLLRKGLYDGSLDQFKEQFFGVKKKEPTSETSASGSDASYVGTAGVEADGSTLEKKLNSFNIVREGQEFSQGKKETTLAQIRQMKTDRPDQTIVQIKDDKGKPTLRYLDEHKDIIKKKANRVPDAATLEAKPVNEAVLDFYSNKPAYVDMVEERRARGFSTQYNEGKFVAEGIREMQTDVRNAIDLKVKEIGKNTLTQYLNLKESFTGVPQDSPEFAKLMADYNTFNQAHPDLQEYEGLVNRFWALDTKNKEAQKNPAYKGYFDNQAKKEQAQITADMWAMTGLSNDPTKNNPFLPAASKEIFDLGTGLVRAAAGIERFVTGKKYGNLDYVVENLEQIADPSNYAATATPSNRTQLVGQRYSEVGDYKVLLDGDKIMSVVSKDGGFQLRDQKKAQEVVAEFERTKPKVKTQAINTATATDVIIGGAVQMATSLGAAGIGAKIGKVGSIASSVGSKTATIATNAAGTYNKLYTSAIQELGPSNQKAAERYAALSSLAMSTLGTLINPLEQQILNVGSRQAIKTMAKELSEGVAEQTAIRNAVRSLITFGKTVGKESLEGAPEAIIDDTIKAGVNKAMLGEDDNKFEFNLGEDILNNVAEEGLGALFSSVMASKHPSKLQEENLEYVYKSPERTKVLKNLSKEAVKHYEKVFAQADLNPKKSLLKIHQEELIKAKTGEELVVAPATPSQEASQTDNSSPEVVAQPTTTALNLAATLDPQQGDKITTPMGQSGTIVGFDIDEDDEEETPRYYKVQMDESGEEALISIADYNKNIYERGIIDLQSQGMSRGEAEFAVEAARSVKDISYQPSQVQPDAVTTEDNLLPDVGNMADQSLDGMIEETPGPDDGIVEDTPEPVDQAQTDQLIPEPEPTPEATVQPISEPVAQTPTAPNPTTSKSTPSVVSTENLTLDTDKRGKISFELKKKNPTSQQMADYYTKLNEASRLSEQAQDEQDEDKSNALFQEVKKIKQEAIEVIRGTNASSDTKVLLRDIIDQSVLSQFPGADKVLIKSGGVSFGNHGHYDPNDNSISVVTSEESFEKTLLHEMGHLVWNKYLSDQQKEGLSDNNPLTEHGKKVLNKEDTSYSEIYTKEGIHNEEDFAELFAENNGNLDAILKLKGVQPISEPVVTEPKMKSFTEAAIINQEQAKITQKLGEKKGQKYSNQAMRLVNPNENEIVEFRANGIVTKEGDKYILNAFDDTELKTWGIGMKLDVTDQFVSEEKVTPEDIQLARKLLGQAKDTVKGALQETGAKVTKALKKYGDVKVVIHDTNAEISAEYNKLAKNKSNVTGFYDPKSKTIHVSLESGNPTHTLLHEALHVFIKGLDTDSFNKLFDELVSIPEYTQVLRTKGRSPKEHAAMYPERKQKEEALVEYFSAIASGEIEVKKDSKIIEILNRLLKLLGLKGAIDNTNIRIVAQGLAAALREGITLEGGPNESDEVEAEVLVDFPYYDKVTKLVENGINKGLSKDQIVQTILSAYNAQNISVPQSLVEAIHTSRTAIRKKGRKPVGKLRTAFSNFHQKYFVANGGGEIREMVERLEGTVQRTVDQVQSLIKLAEKQSKGVDQELVDRYLRDENSLAEKQEIVDTLLRPNNVSEEIIEKYLRGGTTRYQRLEAVKELDPNVDFGPFVESRMNDQDRDLVPVTLAATLTTMRQSLDNLSSYLVDEGYVVGDRTEVILENLGQYMSDVYGIFKDKKFKPTEAAKVKARKYFADQIRKDANKLAALSATGNDLEEEIFNEAERMVNDYETLLKQKNGNSAGAPVAKKSEAIFKQKEGVPDELKDLLGKYGPLQEYAYTMFNLVNYVEKSKFQRRMVDLGKGVFMWDRNDPARPADANYELKGFASDKLKGDTNPFKGMMADQATFETLAGLDKLFFEGGPILEKFLRFQGFVNKSKTVYSYQTHFGNVLGNFFFMAFNGMIDASTATSFKMAGKATGRDLFGRYGIKNDEVDEVLTILKNEQVIGQDVSLMAIRETVGELQKTKTPSDNPFLRGLQKTRDAAVDFDKGLTNVYQAEDNFFKILAYMTERKRYGDALYGKKYDQLDSIQKEEVNRIATEIAKANWPNYGRMGKFSQMAAKNNILFGNFLSFTFEAMRTYGNTWSQATRELKSDNPGVKFIGGKRLAGLVIGSLAADAALMTMAKTASGVFALMFAGDDKTKMNRDLRLGVPKFIQGGDLMFTDKGNGQYEVIDISSKNPLGIFRRHFNSAFFAPTDQEIAAAVSKQFLESFLSQSIAVKYSQAIMKNKDDNDKEIYLKTDTGPEAAEKIFAFTLKSIGPAAINSALKVGKSDDPLVTLGIQISGHNVYKIDFNNTWGKLTSDYADNLSELRKELRKVANDEDATDSEFKAALKKYNQKRKKELERLAKLKQSMINVGVKEAGIEAGIENITKIDRSYLKTGRFREKNYSRKELLYD